SEENRDHLCLSQSTKHHILNPDEFNEEPLNRDKNEHEPEAHTGMGPVGKFFNSGQYPNNPERKHRFKEWCRVHTDPRWRGHNPGSIRHPDKAFGYYPVIAIT